MKRTIEINPSFFPGTITSISAIAIIAHARIAAFFSYHFRVHIPAHQFDYSV